MLQLLDRLRKPFDPNATGVNIVRMQWDFLSRLPGGKAVFSRTIGLIAPYTGTIGARIQELSSGYAKVEMSDRSSVRNHLRCVHAVALVNLAELTGNIALGYSLPDDGRFIVAGLSVEYLKKARGTITATTRCPVPPTSERKEYIVPVEMHDAQGVLVATASLRSLVGPKS